MTKLDEKELEQIVSAARMERGGKPAKYPSLERYGETIVQMLANDVQLPFILRWLIKEKGETLVLNTLRKYVISKIGRAGYDEYLHRNGWAKKKRSAAPLPSHSPGEKDQAQGAGAGFFQNLANLTKDEGIARENGFKQVVEQIAVTDAAQATENPRRQ